MLKKSTLLIIVLLVMCGCNAATTRYVIIRDVPDNPSFVVIPFNSNQIQIACSDYAESALIASGVRVSRRPKVKDIETRKGIGGTKSGLGTSTEENYNQRQALAKIRSDEEYETRIEKYYELEDLNADYVVQTNGNTMDYATSTKYESYRTTNLDSIIVKITKRSENIILCSFVSSQSTIGQDMYLALKSLGIHVVPNAEFDSLMKSTSK
jgi:hypothetical protein